jgi:transcriptional regulator with XRE-family HTH domain
MEIAYITPEVIKWARNTARYSIKDVARFLNIPAVNIIEWEKGLLYPNIEQAEVLAKLYKRPFAVFFLPEVPKFLTLKDF